jgi:hypothetical protein
MSLLAARLQLDLHEIEIELLHVRASQYLSGIYRLVVITVKH